MNEKNAYEEGVRRGVVAVIITLRDPRMTSDADKGDVAAAAYELAFYRERPMGMSAAAAAAYERGLSDGIRDATARAFSRGKPMRFNNPRRSRRTANPSNDALAKAARAALAQMDMDLKAAADTTKQGSCFGMARRSLQYARECYQSALNDSERGDFKRFTANAYEFYRNMSGWSHSMLFCFKNTRDEAFFQTAHQGYLDAEEKWYARAKKFGAFIDNPSKRKPSRAR